MLRRPCPGASVSSSHVSGAMFEHLQENFRGFKARPEDPAYPQAPFPDNTMGCSFGKASVIRPAPILSFMGPLLIGGRSQDKYFFKSSECEINYNVPQIPTAGKPTISCDSCARDGRYSRRNAKIFVDNKLATASAILVAPLTAQLLSSRSQLAEQTHVADELAALKLKYSSLSSTIAELAASKKLLQQQVRRKDAKLSRFDEARLFADEILEEPDVDDDDKKHQAFIAYGLEQIEKELRANKNSKGEDLKTKDRESVELMKEQFLKHFENMGKFNKSGNKRGINTDAPTSRILYESYRRASVSGQHEYETQMRSQKWLPSWSTITNYQRKVDPGIHGFQDNYLLAARLQAAELPACTMDNCTLVFDECTIIENVEWVNGKVHGFCDIASHPLKALWDLEHLASRKNIDEPGEAGMAEDVYERMKSFLSRHYMKISLISNAGAHFVVPVWLGFANDMVSESLSIHPALHLFYFI